MLKNGIAIVCINHHFSIILFNLIRCIIRILEVPTVFNAHLIWKRSWGWMLLIFFWLRRWLTRLVKKSNCILLIELAFFIVCAGKNHGWLLMPYEQLFSLSPTHKKITLIWVHKELFLNKLFVWRDRFSTRIHINKHLPIFIDWVDIESFIYCYSFI